MYDDGIDDEEFRNMQETLSLERAVHAEKSPEELAEQMLRDAAPIAAQTLVKLASAGSENVRYRAATWIMDHISKTSGSDGRSPWDDLLDEVTVTQARK